MYTMFIRRFFLDPLKVGKSHTEISRCHITRTDMLFLSTSTEQTALIYAQNYS